VLVIIPNTGNPAHAQLHLPSGSNQTIPPSDIFGAELPEVGQFALIATGRPGYVRSTGCTGFRAAGRQGQDGNGLSRQVHARNLKLNSHRLLPQQLHRRGAKDAKER
jgi:hypothetical protein